MNQSLESSAKKTAEEIIALSQRLQGSRESWGDVPQRPNNLGVDECVGFINKEDPSAKLNLVVDIVAPANANEAMLRAWCIAQTTDAAGNDLFNNIQLDFNMDYNIARSYSQKGSHITHKDLMLALNEPTTKLRHITVSNQSGVARDSGEQLGNRYEMAADEFNQDNIGFVQEALSAALANVKDLSGA